MALAKPFWLKPIFKINYYIPPAKAEGNSKVGKKFIKWHISIGLGFSPFYNIRQSR